MNAITIAKSSRPFSAIEFVPPKGGTGKLAAVVVYGTDALHGPFDRLIKDFCSNLAASGLYVVLPDFFAVTGTQPGFSSVAADLSAANVAHWETALVDTANDAKTRANRSKSAFIGFSLGGYLATRAAAGNRGDCLIDFFGPVTTFGLMPFPKGAAITEALAATLPPTQVHHGTLDEIVRESESATLDGWISKAGGSSEFWHDYRCGHPGQPAASWTSAAQTLATQRSQAFLLGHN